MKKKKADELKEYYFQVPVSGFQNYYVKAKSKEEAVHKIYESHEDVETDLDDIDWNTGHSCTGKFSIKDYEDLLLDK